MKARIPRFFHYLVHRRNFFILATQKRVKRRIPAKIKHLWWIFVFTFILNFFLVYAFGRLGMLEELTIAGAVGVAIAAVAIVLYFKKWKTE
ncbi:MAG: hypothetical protein GWO20_08815 [Candidatus Korarchaeota archaeon]|nr:hypothetical protein [Candidatus Korarchaeota archaeon]NIU83523.1 hypothetical protein [Candidatus Thorarchaeota archaeon]NIW13788.1 hypothetical protein [Candidatus Thorarchaeota archaeon]NIW51916.1 hypothetical protein [Candidatus Korarchaeota archaeon]